jgi:ComEC/Rec2-related protein
MAPSLFWYLGAFFFGLFGSTFFVWSWPRFWPLFFLLLTLISRTRPRWRYVCFFLFCLSVGFWRAQNVFPVDIYLRSYFTRTEIWNFQVCADPEPAWDKQIVVLCPLSPSFSQGASREKVAANLPLYPRVFYGDKLSVRCRLEKPPVFADFDYAAYLAAKGVGGLCVWPQILQAENQAGGQKLMRSLLFIKRQALLQINAALPEPAAGLAAALLLGYKKTLYPKEEVNFQKAGLSHLVAISGGHISLFLNLLLGLFIYFGLNKNQAAWPSLFLASAYVVLSGSQASAWRSLLMGSIMLYTWRRGRLSSAWTPLFLAGAVMLWQNPELWQRDLGFQLSFLALAGMIAFNPIFSALSESCLRSRWRKKYLGPLFSALSLSLSAQLAVWPLLALKSGGVSLISPLANVFAFGVFGPLVLSLLGALSLSAIFGLHLIFWWPSYLLLSYLLFLGKIAASLPGAYLDLPSFKPLYAFLYYFVLLLGLFFYYRLERIHRARAFYFNN